MITKIDDEITMSKFKVILLPKSHVDISVNIFT